MTRAPQRPQRPDCPQSLRRAERIARIREMQAQGMTNKQMAQALCIAKRTLENFILQYRLTQPEWRARRKAIMEARA